jgi:hypothetical protein
MRKISILFLSLMLVSAVYSQVLMDENFDYTAGDSLTAHGWVRHSGTQGQPLVVTPGLTFSGYVLSGIGNAARLDTVGVSGIDVNKVFTADSSTSVYTAFMVKVLYAASAGEYFFHISPSVIGTTFRAKVFARDSSGSLQFGLTKAANTGIYAPGGYSYNTTYLIIVKYKFLTGSTTDDEVSMYIFNASLPGTEPSTPTVGPLTEAVSDLNNAGTVALRQGVNTSRPILIQDGIRVFKSWTNLVSVKPISEVAESFAISQNYPNPFNPSTKVQFSIPENGLVTMKVYNMLGQVVKETINEKLSRGTYEYNFDGTGLSSGIYMYKIEANGVSGKIYSDIKRMSLVK